MTLGELIQQYRSEQNLSQRQFALMCGISNGFISMIEKNTNPNTKESITPSIKKLKQIADGMNISLMELCSKVEDIPIELTNDSLFQFYAKKQQPNKNIMSFDNLNADEQQLIEDYRNLNEQGQNYIKQTMHMATQTYKKMPDLSNLENQA